MLICVTAQQKKRLSQKSETASFTISNQYFKKDCDDVIGFAA